jgi:predicted amidohydrolase
MRYELALAQMAVVGGDLPGNLQRAERMIAEAAAHGSRLVVLPETLDLGWTHPASGLSAEPVPYGEPFRRLAQAAAAGRIIVCAGLTERAGDRVFNAAVIIGADGRLLSLHRKIAELDIGEAFYARGDRLTVVPTELGTLGLMICADGNAPGQVLSRSLCAMGAGIILSPCAWAVTADHDQAREPYGGMWREAYGAVAADFPVWIAGVSNVGPMDAGPWAGRNCIGCSLVVAPGGREALQGPYGVAAEALLYIDVEPAR